MEQKPSPRQRRLTLLFYFLGSYGLFQLLVIGVYSRLYPTQNVVEVFYSEVFFWSIGAGAIALIKINTNILYQSFQQIKDSLKPFVKRVVGYSVLMFAMVLILSLVASQLSGGIAVANQNSIAKQVQQNSWMMVVTAALLGPFVEEMVFRYAMMDIHSESILRQRLLWIGSSLVFGAMHIVASLLIGEYSQLWHILPYVGVGLVLGHLYRKYNNIALPIAVHTLYNTISMGLLLLSR